MSDLAPIVEQIKNRISIIDIVEPTVSLRRRSGRLVALCPFHSEKTPSFQVDVTQGTYHCFGCSKHGDHFSFLMEKMGMTFHEALLFLADKANVELPKFDKNKNDEEVSSTKTWYYILQEANLWYQNNLTLPKAQYVRDYLKKRNVSLTSIAQFQLGYAPKGMSLKDYLLKRGYTIEDLKTVGLVNDKGFDRFQGRLIFPIWDAKERVVAFGGRALQADQMPKYLNSQDTPLFHKGKILYAQHFGFSNVQQDNPPIVVEGYMDVLMMHQHGFTTAVAPLGTAFTDYHMNRLWQRHAAPVMCFDGDFAGQNAAFRVTQKIFPLLKPNFSVGFCFLPNGEDPDSFLKTHPKLEFQNLLKTPVSLIDTLWKGLVNKFDVTTKATPEVKTQFKKALLEQVGQITDSDLRGFYQNDLKDRIYKFFQTPSHQNSFSAQNNKDLASSAIQNLQVLKKNKKKLQTSKILLGILKNNPMLISTVYEMLLQIDDLNDDFLAFKDFLCEQNYEDAQHLAQKAQERGFAWVLEEIDALKINMLSFAKPGADEELALSTWKEMWYQRYIKPQIQDDEKRMKEVLLNNKDEKVWEQWQQMKTVQNNSLEE